MWKSTEFHVSPLFLVTLGLSALLGAAAALPAVLGAALCHELGHLAALGAFRVPVESVRCGEISGIHELGFEGLSDRIVLRHEAFSREGFARGAVQAALWCDGLEDGIYEFKDLIKF